MNDITKWIIVAIAIGGLIFNSGVLWNDVRHLKKAVDTLWKKIDNIEKYLREHKNNDPPN